MDFIHPLGFLGPVYALVSLCLLGWLLMLFFRVRPLIDFIGYLAASLYPLFLGIFAATLGTYDWFYTLGHNGIASPTAAPMLANILGEVFTRCTVGSLLTCIFFPLGILTLLVRRPR